MVVRYDYTNALLEAFGNKRFRQYLLNNKDKDKSEELRFCVEGTVYHIERKDGKWRIGHYPIADTCWEMIIKGKTLIISV